MPYYFLVMSDFALDEAEASSLLTSWAVGAEVVSAGRQNSAGVQCGIVRRDCEVAPFHSVLQCGQQLKCLHFKRKRILEVEQY